jgi:Flp pilus assembly protein TadD
MPDVNPSPRARRLRRWFAVCGVGLAMAACTSSENPQIGGPVGEVTYQSMLRVGDRAKAAGDLAAAATVYRRAHEAEPSAAEPLLKLGTTLYEAGQPEQAAQAFQEALRRQPGSLEGLRGLGSSFVMLDQAVLAAPQFEAALRLDPKDVRALNGIGVALDMQGRHGEAQARYRLALGLDPQHFASINNLGLSLAIVGETAEAIAILTSVSARADAGPRVRQNLALAYGIAGDLETAEKICRADYDEEATRRLLQYFTVLRALPPQQRSAEIRRNPVYFPRRLASVG